jgi:hypothetical protein
MVPTSWLGCCFHRPGRALNAKIAGAALRAVLTPQLATTVAAARRTKAPPQVPRNTPSGKGVCG